MKNISFTFIRFSEKTHPYRKHIIFYILDNNDENK